MTTELLYLTLTALFTGFLWIPAVAGQVAARGFLQPQDYVTLPTAELPDWAIRANRAHLNAMENFGLFAAVIVVGHLAEISTTVTQVGAAVYFFGRVVHAVIFIAGVKHLMARTLVFTVAWGAFLAIGIEVLRLGLA